MGQPGFFDLQHRYEGLDAKSDPLVAILAVVLFELFRGKLKTALVKGGLRRSDGTRKSAAGRKPWDEEIGRASCRERVCQYVEISVVAVSLKKKHMRTDIVQIRAYITAKDKN